MPNELTKPCQRCNKIKPLSSFHHNSTKPDFHNGICKECQKEVNQTNNK